MYAGTMKISLIISDPSCHPFVDQISTLPQIPAATGNAQVM
jgi:hypothetical protein